MMMREEKANVLRNCCNFWFVLDRKTQNDLIDGKCTYAEYNLVPIIDYSRPHPIFAAPEITG